MTDDSEFVEFWNTVLVPKFLRFQDILVEGLVKHSRVLFDRDTIANRGERVRDVGCGFGDTSMDMAHQVGPGERVTSIDCCSAFLEVCCRNADRAGFQNVEWVEGDAETH